MCLCAPSVRPITQLHPEPLHVPPRFPWIGVKPNAFYQLRGDHVGRPTQPESAKITVLWQFRTERVKKLTGKRNGSNLGPSKCKYEHQQFGHSSTTGCRKSASAGPADPGCGVTD